MFAEEKLEGASDVLEHPTPVTVTACEDPIVVDKSPFESRTGLLQRYPTCDVHAALAALAPELNTPRLYSAASTTAIIRMAHP
jgi:hypothetical protein